MTLAETYRPRRFVEVLGQEGVRWMLQALVAAHPDRPFPGAVLLAGPSGTGKTSLARIVARALNCEAPLQGEPCLQCGSCQQSLAGGHPAIIEPPSGFASADDARALVESAGIAHPFRHLVVVLDEAHAMSRQAWDVLLRTVEATPPGISFVFCSTSPERLRPEALSRVFRFDLTPPTEAQVAGRLVQAAQMCSRSIDEAASFDIASRARGNVRKALQLLEKVLLHPEADVQATIGPSGFGLALVEAAVRRDRTAGMRILDEAWAQYGNAAEVYADWMGALEQLLRYKCDAEIPDNPAAVARIRDVSPAYHETMIAAGMEALAEWARQGGRRGTLAFAWVSFLKAINGPTRVDALAVGVANNGSRKVTSADISSFTL